jgi:hypothetical protein
MRRVRSSLVKGSRRFHGIDSSEHAWKSFRSLSRSIGSSFNIVWIDTMLQRAAPMETSFMACCSTRIAASFQRCPACSSGYINSPLSEDLLPLFFSPQTLTSLQPLSLASASSTAPSPSFIITHSHSLIISTSNNSPIYHSR